MGNLAAAEAMSLVSIIGDHLGATRLVLVLVLAQLQDLWFGLRMTASLPQQARG